MPGTLTTEFRIGTGAFALLSASTFTAAAGQLASVRAKACTPTACSDYGLAAVFANPCPAPPPPPPPPTCKSTQKCCEPRTGGGCDMCIAKTASCP